MPFKTPPKSKIKMHFVNTHVRGYPYKCITVWDLVMRAPIQLQCIFPIPFWPILKWNHMHLIHINQNWYPVFLVITTNVRDPHPGHE